MSIVLIAEEIDGPALAELAPPHELHRVRRITDAADTVLATAKALVVRNRTQVDTPLLERMPHLQIIARAGSGLDNIDVEAASARGIVVSYAPVQNAVAVAEYVFAAMFYLMRNLGAADAAVRRGDWTPGRFGGGELYKTQLGIVGLGNIGARVARRARAFGMRVWGYDPFVSHGALGASESGAVLCELSELLQRAEILTLHVPAGPATHHLIGRDELGRLPRGAIVINAARGSILDEDALADALESGHIGGAALDVRGPEPPLPDARLHSVGNVLLTPHLAGRTREAETRVLACMAADLARVLAGQEALSYANFARPRR